MLTVEIKQLIAEQIDAPVSSLSFTATGGGSISNAYIIHNHNKPSFFCKLNSSSKFPRLFEKEKNGLEAISKAGVIRTPVVASVMLVDDTELILMELIQPGSRTNRFWEQFGEQLAFLHHVTAENFGFDEDNYIGSLPQSNNRCSDWISFFIQERLEPQITLALKNKLLYSKHIDKFHRLYDRLTSIFSQQPASLLHGDLWSGNFLCDSNEQPVLIDPAVYYGNRNMDLAMTTLFGGFDPAFYEAYNHHFPLDTNYKEQWEISNLYPLLVHLNLFGSSYLGSITSVTNRF
jgi:protein-ribulosamine 3-kinase